jgi:hypothetical protein
MLLGLQPGNANFELAEGEKAPDLIAQLCEGAVLAGLEVPWK